MTAEATIEGGCHCGAIRYSAAGPLTHQTLCHCSICRKVSGAPAVAWVTVPAQGFQIVRGDPVVYRSSETGLRMFCGTCGSQLSFQGTDSPGEIDITTATLDDPGIAAPKDHTWTSSRLDWDVVQDGLPQFANRRTTA
ncbi:MAG: GFA family protein [Comamonadaceae bacterium]|nr:MAG: GFA family protein [Comamonadaceae bacterium]